MAKFTADYKKSGFLVSIMGESDVTLIRRLNALPAKIEGQILRKALRSGAKITLTRFKQLMAGHSESGRMIKAAKVRAMKRKKGRVGVTITMRTAEAIHGPFAELGHHAGSRSLPDRKFVEGIGVLDQAFKDTDDIVLGHLRGQISKGIEAVAASK
jgi:hypothetical protein